MHRVVGIADTTIGKKALVAISGVILFGFIIGHMLGNLQIFLGPEVFNHYAETLKGMPVVLWGTRVTLLVAVITHIVLSIQLGQRSSAARPQRYHIKRDLVTSYAAKSMLLSGPIVGFYILFHLAHLTFGAPVVPGYEFQAHDAYSNFIHGFRYPPVAVLYIVANALIGLHLFHGSRSFMQSLGLEHPRYDKLVRGVSFALGMAVATANIIMPLAVLTRLVGADVP